MLASCVIAKNICCIKVFLGARAEFFLHFPKYKSKMHSTNYFSCQHTAVAVKKRLVYQTSYGYTLAVVRPRSRGQMGLATMHHAYKGREGLEEIILNPGKPYFKSSISQKIFELANLHPKGVLFLFKFLHFTVLI